jgi:hypothetical protein
MSAAMTSREVFGLPIAFRPAAVIRFVRTRRRARALFISDVGEPGRRGVKRCAVRSTSSFFCVLSIHPKQSASSTASLYEMRGFPVSLR